MNSPATPAPRPAARARRGTAWVILIACLMWPMAGCGEKKPPKDRFAGQTADEIYAIGARQIERGKYGKARRTLESALGRATTTPEIIANVHLGLADAYFLDGGLLNLAEALSRYTNFLTFYPNHERADYAQYRLALCYLKQALSPDRDQSQTRKALAEFMKVSTLYPNSSYVGPAMQKAAEARQRLAESEFRIGRFYFRSRAWEGAVDRFRAILDDYPLYSGKPRVYLLLGRSLLALDREDEGNLYLEKVIAEYPQTTSAYEAEIILQESSGVAEGGP